MRSILVLSLTVLLQACITINTSPQQSPLPDNVLSLEEFNRIKPGLTNNDVIEIAGFRGQEIQPVDSNGNAVILYQNPDESYATIYFERLRVARTEQTGLK